MKQRNVIQLQQGFSLAECLVALVIVTLMITIINRNILQISQQELTHWQHEQRIEQLSP